MTDPIGDEVLDLRMQAALDTDELARLRRGLQATHQALLDEQAAGRNAFVMAAPAWAYCTAVEACSWAGDAQEALLAAHRATTPSPTPATHVIVAVDELERLKDAKDYVGKMANRLGVDNPAGVNGGNRYEMERIGEACLAEAERLKAVRCDHLCDWCPPGAGAS